YLIELPWQRTLHGYATLLAGVMTAILLALYSAVGAVRWVDRRPRISDLARAHLGGVFGAFALALCWGYMLEAPEFIAGLQNVPFDAILTDVRIPVSRFLGGLAL